VTPFYRDEVTPERTDVKSLSDVGTREMATSTTSSNTRRLSILSQQLFVQGRRSDDFEKCGVRCKRGALDVIIRVFIGRRDRHGREILEEKIVSRLSYQYRM
jgi:hypothetical protein